MSAILGFVFVGLMVIGVPIAFAMLIAGLVAVWLKPGMPALVVLLAALFVLEPLGIPVSAVASACAAVLFAVAAAPTAAIVLMQGNPFQTPSFVSPAPIAQMAQPSP